MSEVKVDVAMDAARLARSLDEQVALFQRWLAVEADKREALLRRDRVALEKAVAVQEELLRDIEDQHAICEAVLRRAAAEAGDPWRRLIDSAPPRLADALRARRARLVELVREVREVSGANQHLLRLALAHNAAVLYAFSGATDDGTYGPSGFGSGSDFNVVRGRGFVDRQA